MARAIAVPSVARCRCNASQSCSVSVIGFDLSCVSVHLVERSHSGNGLHIGGFSKDDPTLPAKISLGVGQDTEVFGLTGSHRTSVMLTGAEMSGATGLRPSSRSGRLWRPLASMHGIAAAGHPSLRNRLAGWTSCLLTLCAACLPSSATPTWTTATGCVSAWSPNRQAARSKMSLLGQLTARSTTTASSRSNGNHRQISPAASVSERSTSSAKLAGGTATCRREGRPPEPMPM